ncbi:MAG: hypothetical protein HXS52_05420 [Theionarchaea archaeon]|nr:hypothetical protein [Theionarchaea archaeon]
MYTSGSAVEELACSEVEGKHINHTISNEMFIKKTTSTMGGAADDCVLTCNLAFLFGS